MLFRKRMSDDRRKKIDGYIQNLEDHGEITKDDFLLKSNRPSIIFDIHQALEEYFGQNDDEGSRFVERVLLRYGTEKNGFMSKEHVNGYERARQLLLRRPKDLEELERFLDE